MLLQPRLVPYNITVTFMKATAHPILVLYSVLCQTILLVGRNVWQIMAITFPNLQHNAQQYRTQLYHEISLLSDLTSLQQQSLGVRHHHQMPSPEGHTA